MGELGIAPSQTSKIVFVFVKSHLHTNHILVNEVPVYEKNLNNYYNEYYVTITYTLSQSFISHSHSIHHPEYRDYFQEKMHFIRF